ncbi:iron(III) transport system ATP-binding protein [Desulfacinum infernum DSM 9756]|uniref:Iron(III) transport system ATP-binding protein n=1 Tax=Desulfacinum infernum DSM 9756 TaxID=1121391 RepID=A0A1M4VPR6_9BACT|nr:ABC transporter ATP-binding protein [Desulfacinum infernum]SHE70837.1 iron(III) transport system ATP-binding protein [Desulfacinum infernum DSM 9756]
MEIRITGLTKIYESEGKKIHALDRVDLTVPANHIFTLLGPSGCGKTTLLRCLVGLESPDEGEISIGEEVVWSREKGVFVPPEKRGLGMVFQTYAIWPHMTVFDNVAYPLQVRRLPRDEIRSKVAAVLKLVQLDALENRPATKLSGGQQQRVALARALVAEPKVILFDEPLSNLDAKLREETRKELRQFLTELGITAVYVTHDRVEALSLSDSIAVMKDGQIVEIGSPQKIYFQAEHPFVADFIGRANLIPGTVETREEDLVAVETPIGKVLAARGPKVARGDEVTVCVRPEFIRVVADPLAEGINTFSGVVESLVFVGEAHEGEVRVGETLLNTRIDPDVRVRRGDRVGVRFDPNYCFLVTR